MFFTKQRGVKLVNRGDPESADFTKVDLTTDGNWHELDMSSVIPKGAIAAVLAVRVLDDGVGNSLTIRPKAHSYPYHRFRNYQDTINQASSEQGIVFFDTDRAIEYLGSNVEFTSIEITVIGWWI